ncbi:hypothetical protein [Natronobacterium texcoconense]|uniref:Flagellin N-terminal-like domain-containing protein n=1 Tax=Natronobacterium texcoconense TaxID=1095778 RepID=A0A1H1B5W2_NATTX|nr:hypothetical protein [Natronobacterium texcoconense]SDQ47319.1 hypothetical protein SAMN04489842_0935 [Natronobacterium texcoconense]
MVDRRREQTRGQLILIGAIALAFIILGVVVVFNGVLYTETISSSSTSQSASNEEVTGLEIEQSVGCLLAMEQNGTLEDDFDAEIDRLRNSYRNLTAQSTPAVADIEVTETNPPDSVNVTITYDSHDLSYTQTREIEPGAENCPDES